MGVDEGDHSYWWYVVFAGALGLLAAPALRNNDRGLSRISWEPIKI
jgi:hypothetical protein